LSDLEDKLEQIKTVLAELRTTADDDPATRKQLYALFRQVHSLKAVASADGLTDLSRAAHELENVLHSLRTGKSTLDNRVLQQLKDRLSETLPLPDEFLNSLNAEEKHALRQSLNEGAKLFFVHTGFDLADFDQEFQNLKAKLERDGEVISVAPKVESNKINFRILYATRADNLRNDLGPNVSAEEIVLAKAGGSMWDRIVRTGESTAAALGKEVHFDLRGTEILVDNAITDCLIHLVRNAVHHGIESHGTITITATSEPGELTIKVTDDGRGIDPQLIASGQLFQPGYSTASEVSEIAGRGVGLDVVRTTVEARGGSVKIQSEPGLGSTFEITLPSKSV
jgi:two-component system chemotaxis sensor kinase CheA